MRTILLSSGRTGSTVICDSLFKAGLPVKYEPLHHLYASTYPNPDEPYIIGQSKIDAVNKSMENAILCKILYYQLDEELLKQLYEEYQLIHMVRSPLQVYISWKIAEHTKKWQENTDVPRVKLDVKNFINFLTRYTFHRSLCEKYSCMEIHYTDIFNWDAFIHRFQNYLGIDPVFVPQTIKQSQYNKKDVVENYNEIIETYKKFYEKLV